MNEKTIVCPLNGLPARIYVRKGRAIYYLEPKSGLIFQGNLPTVNDMEAFNQSEYESGSYKAYVEMGHLKKRTARNRLEKIRKFGKASGNLLDVGCSAGLFLEVAQEFGFKVHGVELSAKAIELAKPDIRKLISKADANKHIKKYGAVYDVVTAYDIIEHTQEPKVFLKDLYNALAPEGVVAIATPDSGHFLRYLMRGSWSMLQPMQHTFLFSRRGLKSLLEETGFQEVQIMSAKKTLTINYLFGQLAQTNPLISRLYKIFKFLIPSFIGDAMFDLNISEFLALARKVPAKTKASK